MDADSLEERISGKISKDFNQKEEEIFGLIEKLKEGKGSVNVLIRQAQGILSKRWKYEIQPKWMLKISSTIV